LIPFVSNTDNFLNKKEKKKDNNNNILLSENKSILNSTNNNLIYKEKDKNNANFKYNEDYSKVNTINKEQYINEMKKEIKNNTLLNNSFTSFYIKNKNLSINKPYNIKPFSNHNKIYQDKSNINLMLKKNLSRDLYSKIDNNININDFYQL